MTLAATMDAHRRLFDAHLAGCFDEIEPKALAEATRWYPEAGGKRLRPIIAMLACEAAGGQPEDAIPVALAVELVHSFSLVHDDIMDRDDLRRGRPTVHRKWDEATAILAGDVLFALAFEVLARLPAPAHAEAVRILSSTVRDLCEGQALDIAFESQEHVTPAEYLHMIGGKTARLFDASGRAGALCAPGAPAPAVAALGRYGDALGLAFQITDDLLDLEADSKQIGKPWGSDIRAGKRTLMVLDALESADDAQRKRLLHALGEVDASDDDVRAAIAALEACGAMQRAREQRDAHVARAAHALEDLAPSDARNQLAALNQWARTRTF